ncbi:MAG: DUF262 domain-containing protein [Bryobacteraceae bacterium]
MKSSTHSVRWWRNRNDQIDTAPPYQRRGRLWSDTDKAYLIDSILNEFDVPKIYMADFTYGDSALNLKRLPYAIIDGRQRWEAILDFYEGRLTLNDDFVLLERPTLRLAGLAFKDLQKNFPEVAERFEEYELSVMSVITGNEDLINELFVRLNRSKPLTGAEIRNAMKGPAPALIRQIAKHEFFTADISFPVQRGDDWNAAAKMLSFEYFDELRATKKRDLNNFVKETGELPQTRLELAGRQVVETLTDMTEIFLPKDRLLASSGVIPVYFWFVRGRRQTDLPRIREFLVQFEALRSANRDVVKQEPNSTQVDRELVEYDHYNRSTNDLQSHEGRYRILVSRFNTWVKSKRRS